MMYKNALHEILNRVYLYRDTDDCEMHISKDCFQLIITALEKQIPKKPVEVRNEIVCPTCKTLVGSSPYCRYCGQALDHSGTKIFESGKGSNPIVENDQVYLIDEQSSPEEVGKAFKMVHDRLMSEPILVDDHAYPDEAPSLEEIEDFFISLNEMLMEMEEEDMGY